MGTKTCKTQKKDKGHKDGKKKDTGQKDGKRKQTVQKGRSQKRTMVHPVDQSKCVGKFL